jgi:hypothetical protein
MSKTKSTTSKPGVRFRGYASPNYTMVPDELFDEQLPDLSGGELKALLYIMRRTFGFKKPSDDISLSQICDGITTRDGRTLDRGTGLSRSTAQVAIKGLVDKNLITATRRYSAERGYEATTYCLNLVSTPYTENRSSPGPKIDPALDRKSVIQETVGQYTDQQETAIHSKKTDSSVFPSKDQDARLSTSLRSRATVDNGRVGEASPPPPSEPASYERLRTVARSISSGRSPRPTSRGGEAGRSRQPKAPYIEATITDFSGLILNDPDHARANVTRAIRLWQSSGMDEERFVQEVIYPARSLTQQAGDIKKRAGDGSGRRNKAPYFFAVVEDLLGLREGRGA